MAVVSPINGINGSDNQLAALGPDDVGVRASGRPPLQPPSLGTLTQLTPPDPTHPPTSSTRQGRSVFAGPTRLGREELRLRGGEGFGAGRPLVHSGPESPWYGRDVPIVTIKVFPMYSFVAFFWRILKDAVVCALPVPEQPWESTPQAPLPTPQPRAYQAEES